MKNSFNKILNGYAEFKKKYASGDQSIMQRLSSRGQSPDIMVVACCDSRVDPSLILQTDPGDLFVVRNVANIVPPYQLDEGHHGTSAALEFGVCYLHIKHLILLGHSQCGGLHALLNNDQLHQNDFISKWVSQIELKKSNQDVDSVAKKALLQSYQNCLTFPWIQKRISDHQLVVHVWYFDIETANIFAYDADHKQFEKL